MNMELRQPVRPARARIRRHCDLAATALAQEPRASDVVGVHVSLERVAQLQAQFPDQRGIAPGMLEHRVDQHGLVRTLVAEQIRVGG